MTAPIKAANSNAVTDSEEFVTVIVGETMFGLAIDRVHDVFVPSGITPVPLAPPEIVGLLNLRGRVVTALCLRRRLGLPDRTPGAKEMAIGLERSGETFAPVPINLDARWRDLSLGVHRLDGRLLVILDVDALLAFGSERDEAAA